jgi:pre-mRNA-splicing factor 38A
MSGRNVDPMNLVEKILQARIFRNAYWKEFCFGLTEETLAERAMVLDHVGGTFGGNKSPTPFICLVLAMLQMQPEREIVLEFIKNEDYKYVRALGAFYLRLVGSAKDIYEYLEPLLLDMRKLRKRTDTGYIHVHMDTFIEDLLSPDNYSSDISLPFLNRRHVLVENGDLQPRVSPLDDTEEAKQALAPFQITEKESESGSSDDDSDLEAKYKERARRERWRKKQSRRSPSRTPSRSPSPARRSRSRRSPSPRRRSPSRSPSRYSRSHRSRSRSPDRRGYRDSHRSRRSPPRPSRHDRDHRRSPPRDDRRSYRDGPYQRPPRQRSPRREKESAPSKGKAGEVSMSVEETNRLRISLGLPPLK